MTQGAELIDMDGSVELLRRALEEAFPEVAFEIAVDGGDVRVSWVDGPTQADVDRVVSLYSGRDFGSISHEDVEHWLTDEGVSLRAKGPDLFVLPPDRVPPGSRRVRFAPRNVSIDRQLSEDFRAELAAMLSEVEAAFDPADEQVREIPFRGMVLRGPGAQVIWQASCYVRRNNGG